MASVSTVRTSGMNGKPSIAMSKISRFTGKAVQLAQNAVADYAVVSLHCPRVYLEKFYRET